MILRQIGYFQALARAIHALARDCHFGHAATFWPNCIKAFRMPP
jgi:hypothetical protein